MSSGYPKRNIAIWKKILFLTLFIFLIASCSKKAALEEVIVKITKEFSKPSRSKSVQSSAAKASASFVSGVDKKIFEKIVGYTDYKDAGKYSLQKLLRSDYVIPSMRNRLRDNLKNDDYLIKLGRYLLEKDPDSFLEAAKFSKAKRLNQRERLILKSYSSNVGRIVSQASSNVKKESDAIDYIKNVLNDTYKKIGFSNLGGGYVLLTRTIKPVGGREQVVKAHKIDLGSISGGFILTFFASDPVELGPFTGNENGTR